MRKKMIALLSVSLMFVMTACSSQSSQVDSETTVKAESADSTEKNTTEKNSTTTGNKTNSDSFSNEYGTASTKCAHPGCNNNIASSGDTNCCTVHSNRCLDCNKYIDEDAMYCMDCLTKASEDASYNDDYDDDYDYDYNDYDYDDYDYDYDDYDYSQQSDNIGEGGYEMPNENDKSFSDYVKRVDPELYDELFSE